MLDQGTPFNRCRKVCRERIEAMKVIWSEEEAEYHGEFVNFDPIWSHPKPVQKPHPPVILGTLSDKGLKRVVNYCDGWIPVLGTVQDMPAAIQQLQELGVDRTVFSVPSADSDTALPLLDKYSGYISQFA